MEEGKRGGRLPTTVARGSTRVEVAGVCKAMKDSNEVVEVHREVVEDLRRSNKVRGEVEGVITVEGSSINITTTTTTRTGEGEIDTITVVWVGMGML